MVDTQSPMNTTGRAAHCGRTLYAKCATWRGAVLGDMTGAEAVAMYRAVAEFCRLKMLYMRADHFNALADVVAKL